MMIAALVTLFLSVIATGPAGREAISRYRDRRREALEPVPMARVLYLPSSSCRSPLDIREPGPHT